MKASYINPVTGNKEKSENLYNGIKESFANVFNYKRNKSFINADLWNLHRRKKATTRTYGLIELKS